MNTEDKQKYIMRLKEVLDNNSFIDMDKEMFVKIIYNKLLHKGITNDDLIKYGIKDGFKLFEPSSETRTPKWPSSQSTQRKKTANVRAMTTRPRRSQS
jgi:hypothetical protein